MKYLILFDVCNTLVNTNSTKEYISFLDNNNLGNKKYAFLLKNKHLSPLYYLIHKYAKYDLYRKFTFKFFKGINIKDEENIKKNFFRQYIGKKTKIMDILYDYKNKKSTEIILISASVNQPIDLLSEYLGIKSFSTKLIIKDNKYTGKVNYDLLGNKELAFKNNNIDFKKYNECKFYTDNISDFSFIKYLYSKIKNLTIYPIINNKTEKNKWEYFLINEGIKYEYIC